MIKITINGQILEVAEGTSILNAASENGINIPNLCYRKELDPYAACGVCLVEVEGMNKLVRSCETKAQDGMVINTEGERANRARKTALELLLTDHTGDCVAPCKKTCPAETDCQGYVGLIANGFFDEAADLIKETFPFPASIGRVCPHPCEEACRRAIIDEPIAIAWLKQFAGDWALENGNKNLPEIAPNTGKNIAVIGAGPAGLTFAYFMALAGHNVKVYDMMPKAGGMLRYGIPEYRLPKAVLTGEIARIEAMGVEINCNTKIDADTFKELHENNDATYLAIGAWQSAGMRCKGEEAEGVLGGIDFLQDVALGKATNLGNSVAIVGGGNTAMDACRTAVRLGVKNVYLLYRRTKDEMPADAVEIKEAEEEGVIFKYLVAPVEVIAENNKVKAISLQKMELGEADASGRRRPVPVEGAIEELPVDNIIAAIGQKVLPIENTDLALTSWNTIVADEKTFATNIAGVFAGGDATNKGPSIAIAAIGEAECAAKVVNAYLEGQTIEIPTPYYVKKENLTISDYPYEEKIPRQKMKHQDADDRCENFLPVVEGYTYEQAMNEASRCLECGCADVYECKLLAYANKYKVEPSKYAGAKKSKPVVDDHPFIIQDINKCVLCGNCVRACKEIVGLEILGLKDRGFETVVSPGFGEALIDTNCISCGTCVSVCPTGALVEAHPEQKNVPLKTIKTPAICHFCGYGCELNIESHGNAITKVTPKDKAVCVKGRFGYPYAMTNYALNPRIDGNSFDLDDVITEAAARINTMQELYGMDSIGIAVGGRLTNEEIFLAKKLASDSWASENIYSANVVGGGIEQVVGENGSTVGFDAIEKTELIVVAGSDIFTMYPILGRRIEKAVANGAKLAIVGTPEIKQMEIADFSHVMMGNSKMEFFVEVSRYLADPMEDMQNVGGFKEFKKMTRIAPEKLKAKLFAEMYMKAKNAVFIYDTSRVQDNTAQLFANMMLMTKQYGKEGAGIIGMRPQVNLQGVRDMGVTKSMDTLIANINAKKIRGLILIGHDIPVNICEKLEFLMAMDTMAGGSAGKAEIFIPLAGFGAVSGSYTRSDGKVNFVNAAVEPLLGKENWQILVDLSKKFSMCAGRYINIETVRADIAYFHNDYAKVYEEGQAYPTVEGDGMRLQYGFNFPDGKAKMAMITPNKLMPRTAVPADTALGAYNSAVKQFGLTQK